MTYETLINKFCPLIRDTCKGESCAAYKGNAEAGNCFMFDQTVGPVPVVGDAVPPVDGMQREGDVYQG